MFDEIGDDARRIASELMPTKIFSSLFIARVYDVWSAIGEMKKEERGQKHLFLASLSATGYENAQGNAPTMIEVLLNSWGQEEPSETMEAAGAEVFRQGCMPLAVMLTFETTFAKKGWFGFGEPQQCAAIMGLTADGRFAVAFIPYTRNSKGVVSLTEAIMSLPERPAYESEKLPSMFKDKPMIPPFAKRFMRDFVKLEEGESRGAGKDLLGAFFAGAARESLKASQQGGIHGFQFYPN